MKKMLLAFFTAIALLRSVTTFAYETKSYIPQSPKNALIIVHGYGGSADRMLWIAHKYKDSLTDTAFYFPTAPDKAPYGGYQWFVIPSMGEDMSRESLYKEMMQDALKNVSVLHNLVEEIHQTQNIPYQNIEISGFSQGGLMAILTALTTPHKIKKAVSLSGVPLAFTNIFHPSLVKNSPKILLIQGDKDNVIPKDSLELTEKTLSTLHITPEIRIIPDMPHTINNEAINYMLNFLRSK